MADGSIIIDATLDTQELEASLANIEQMVDLAARNMSASLSELGSGLDASFGAEIASAAGEMTAALDLAVMSAMGLPVALESAGSGGGAAIEGLLGTLTSVSEMMKSGVVASAGAMAGGVSGEMSGMASVVTAAFTGMLDNITTGFSKKTGEMRALAASGAEGIRTAFAGIDLTTVGSNIMQGLINGINSGRARLSSLLASVSAEIPATLRQVLGIRSPSRVAEEIGRYIDEGLANGISDNADLVSYAVERMASGITEGLTASAEEIRNFEIAAIDAVLEKERAAQKERVRERDLDAKEQAIATAKTNEAKIKAREEYSEALKKYEIEDLESMKKALKEEEAAFEAAKKEQLNILSKIGYSEVELSSEFSRAKIKLFDEEYIARVRALDEGLAVFLEANNTEIEEIIRKIEMNDEAAAKRLRDINEERNAVLAASKSEREAIEETRRQQKEAEMLRRIIEAETAEQQMERTVAYHNWRADEEFKQREAARKEKLKDLEELAKAEIALAKETNETLVAQAVESRKAAEAEINSKIDAVNGGELLGLEKETQDRSNEQLVEFFKQKDEISAKNHKDGIKTKERQNAEEHALTKGFNDNIIGLLSSYLPKWGIVGRGLMDNLISGLNSRLGEVYALINNLQSALDSVSMLQGSIEYAQGGAAYGSSSVPFYGTGGIVSTPRLAVVGDVPEAIIPLDKLGAVVSSLAGNAVTGDLSGLAGSAEKNVKVEQTIIMNQPVPSPAENARAIRNLMKVMAY